MKTDLLQVALLHLKSILGENVLGDRINAQFVMRICLSFELLSIVVEMSQGFTLKQQPHQVELCQTGHQTISGIDQVELCLEFEPLFHGTSVKQV